MNPMAYPPFHARIVDHLLADTCEPETNQLRAQLLTTPPGQGVISALETAIRTDDLDCAPPAVEDAIGRLLARIDPVDSVPLRASKPSRPSLSWRLLSGVFVLGVALLGWVGARYYVGSQLGLQYSTYSTGKGQQAHITLPDGSAVILNVGSRLQVPANYAMGERRVRLSGEALFTVRAQSSHPFIVTAGPSTSRVLGTSFVVRHYPTDSIATVSVRDGKVMTGSHILTSLQRLEVNRRGAIRRTQVSPSVFRFATGVLEFDNVALSDAIVDLGRWSDADIRLGDATLKDQRVTGEFAHESLPSLSNILELMFDVRVVRDGRTLTLFPR